MNASSISFCNYIVHKIFDMHPYNLRKGVVFGKKFRLHDFNQLFKSKLNAYHRDRPHSESSEFINFDVFLIFFESSLKPSFKHVRC